MRRFVFLVTFLTVVACGCGKINGGASPQGLSATTTTTSTTTTTATTTTTTTTTTTIPNVSVPDAVSTTNTLGSVVAKQDLTQAGLVPQVIYVNNSGACYFQDPLTGSTEWNAGSAISQDPAAGTFAPQGSTVTLYLCAGTPTIPIP